MKSLDQIIRAAESRLPDRAREPATLRAVAAEQLTYAGLYDADHVVAVVLRREARRLRSLATREERRRRG